MRVAQAALALFVAAGLAATATSAADLSMPESPVSAVSERTLYIRADLGIASYGTGDFEQDDVLARGGSFLGGSIDDAPFIGAGFGWQLSRHFRVDFTGEYRSHADVKATDYLEQTLTAPDGLLTASTSYDGNFSSIVGLANLYVDLGTWRGFTPYVGAGIGFAHNRMSDFTTTSTGSFEDFATGDIRREVTGGVAGDKHSTDFAWALMAGVSFDLSRNAKLDLGYRYLDLGGKITATTDIINCFCGTVGSPLKATDIDSHEFRIGLRWELDRDAEPVHEPLK